MLTNAAACESQRVAWFRRRPCYFLGADFSALRSAASSRRSTSFRCIALPSLTAGGLAAPLLRLSGVGFFEVVTGGLGGETVTFDFSDFIPLLFVSIRSNISRKMP